MARIFWKLKRYHFFDTIIGLPLKKEHSSEQFLRTLKGKNIIFIRKLCTLAELSISLSTENKLSYQKNIKEIFSFFHFLIKWTRLLIPFLSYMISLSSLARLPVLISMALTLSWHWFIALHYTNLYFIFIIPTVFLYRHIMF